MPKFRQYFLTLIPVFLLVLAFSIDANDQLQPVANPAALGFDTNKLTKIDATLEQSIADGKIIGCSALIFKDGKIAYSKVFGQRNQKKDLPVEQDTIWRIYSMSKPITR